MRFLISVAMIVAATALFCHGYFEGDEAGRALAAAGASPAESELNAVMTTWPYSMAAIDARRMRLDRWIAAPPPAPVDTNFPSFATAQIVAGFSERLPWVDPFAATGIALGGLLLALFLPGTRFRGLALILILLGVAGAGPSFFEAPQQVKTVGYLESSKVVIAYLPWVSLGLLFLGGLVLGPRVSRRRDDD